MDGMAPADSGEYAWAIAYRKRPRPQWQKTFMLDEMLV
jgi:hypothetical protein